MSKRGIDVSQHDGIINWNEVKNYIDFAIIRVGYIGNNEHRLDTQFERNYSECKRLNIPIGVYVYNYAKSTARARDGALWTLDQLENKSLELPVYFDIEDDSLRLLGKDVNTELCIAFNSIIENSGYRAGVYANRNWYDNYLNKDEIKRRYTTWIAHYGVDENRYEGQYDMLQYSESGRVSGISTNVDMNILYREDLIEGGDNNNDDDNPVEENIITDVQSWLNNNYNTNLVVDGLYGPFTKKALIIAYQTELNEQFNRNLDVDGIYGPRTSAAYITIKQGARGNITQIIQGMLYCKDYNPNGFDGIFGSGMKEAVENFQRNRNLVVDGIVGKNTLDNLFS